MILFFSTRDRMQQGRERKWEATETGAFGRESSSSPGRLLLPETDWMLWRRNFAATWVGGGIIRAGEGKC